MQVWVEGRAGSLLSYAAAQAARGRASGAWAALLCPDSPAGAVRTAPASGVDSCFLCAAASPSAQQIFKSAPLRCAHSRAHGYLISCSVRKVFDFKARLRRRLIHRACAGFSE